MKKYFISSVVALALVLGSAAVANAAFTTYMSVGSTGSEVPALQTWLIANGFDIPAITSGAAAKGYFGQQTKAALVRYQASVGLPATGFFGPLTTARVNGTAGSPINTVAYYIANCPIGYTCPVPVPAAGTVVPPPANQAPIVMDGTDGSLTVSLSSFAGNNTIKKGETKDLVAVKLQATAAPVAVTRFDVRFNTRPWLYFSTVTLKDSNGAVIATKNLSSASDATELTVGTDYLVRFEGINAVVTPGTDRTLVVSGTVWTNTDKLTSDVSVIVSVPDNSIRTLNGKGFTDTLGLGTVAVSGTSGRTITLSSSGSTGNILGRINPSTPEDRIVNTSTSGETTGVVLGKFDFKSENRASTVNTLKFTLNTDNDAKAWSSIIKRLYIDTGSQVVQVDAVATTSTFSNLTLNLPQDEWKTVTITADIADQDDFTNGEMASTSITLNTTNVVGVDAGFNTVTVTAGTPVSNDITFLSSGASISNQSATAAPVDNGQNAVESATITFTFTFNNTGTSELYIAKEANTALATTSTVTTAASSTLSSSLTSTSPSTQPSDTSTVWAIPSGTSRTFVYSGTITNGNDTATLHSTSITKVYFDDDTSGLQEFNIDFGLDKLKTPAVSLK